MKSSGTKRDFDFEPSFDNEAEDDYTDVQSTRPDKKRRLRADQVKALERSFEFDNKLEPERKVQLAIELGLDQRQVAIWFQNRRARWKTKQLERDYVSLQSDYDELKRNYESIKRENDTLLDQIVEARIGRGDVVAKKEENVGGGACGFSLDYEGAIYGDVNVVSTDSATSGVHSEVNIVSSYENVGNEEDDNLAIWPSADTYSFLADDEAAPVFNWYCPDPWT